MAITQSGEWHTMEYVSDATENRLNSVKIIRCRSTLFDFGKRKRGSDMRFTNLICLAVLLSLTALSGCPLDTDSRSGQAVSTLEALGCRVGPSVIDNDKPGLDVTIDSRCKDVAEAIQQVEHVKDLRTLNISEVQLGKTGLQTIAGQQGLEGMLLNQVALTENDFKTIGQLHKLVRLGLSQTGLTDTEVASLEGLTKLTDLMLLEHGLTDAGVKPLTALPQLRTLNLADSSIGAAGIAALAPLRHLRVLDLSGSALTDAGVHEVKRLHQLHTLHVWAKHGVDALLRRLLPLSEQSLSLHFGWSDATDKGLTPLQKLRGVWWLSLEGTKISDAGLARLKGLHRLQDLELDYTKITDAGLPDLKGLTRLRRLNVSGTQVTEAGVDQLKKLLPSIKVVDYR